MVSDQFLNFEERLQIFQNLLPATNNQTKRKINKSQIHTITNDSCSTEPDSCEYTCDLCGKNFSRDLQYFGHLKMHSGERQWQCDKCIKHVDFNKQSELHNHEQKFHYQSREYICTELGCGKKYNRPSHLEYHIRREHLNERNYTCHICDKNFFILTDLKYHLNTHLGTNRKVCETCGKSFNHSSNFLRHIRKHQGIKPYQCKYCNKRFTEITILKKHSLTHRTEHPPIDADRFKRKFYCAVCGETFQYVVELRQHESVHERDASINCKSCSQVLPTVDEFKKHKCNSSTSQTHTENDIKDVATNDLICLINDNDQNDGDNDDDNDNEDDDKLDSNSTTTNLNSDWTHIMNSLLNELNIELETQEDMLQTNTVISTTDFEPTEFLELQEEISQLQDINEFNLNLTSTSNSTSDIQQNTSETHPNDSETKVKPKNIKIKIHDEIILKRNICKICGREFAHGSSMHRHLKSHTSNDKIKCNYCDKMLTGVSLHNHVRRIHKMERNFICSLNDCQKMFYKKTDLDIHQRTHTNQKPYKCRICEKTFVNSSHQLRHEKTHKKYFTQESQQHNTIQTPEIQSWI